MKRTPRKRTVAATLIAAGVVAGGAFAYFTTTSSGSTTATVDNADPVSLSPGEPSGDLFPGTSTDVAVEVTNPNPFVVNLPSLVLNTAEGEGGFESSESGCEESALSFSTQNNGGSGYTVPPNAADYALTLDSGALSLSTSAANECQDATFKVFLAVGTS